MGDTPCSRAVRPPARGQTYLFLLWLTKTLAMPTNSSSPSSRSRLWNLLLPNGDGDLVRTHQGALEFQVRGLRQHPRVWHPDRRGRASLPTYLHGPGDRTALCPDRVVRLRH